MEQTLEKITLPVLSEETEESLVVLWYKTVGDTVRKGENLVEVQTEKATSEIEAPVNGILKEICVKRGETASVGDVLAVISQDEEEPAKQKPMAEQSQHEEKSESSSFVPSSPRIRRLAKQLSVDLNKIEGTGPNGKLTEEDVKSAAEASKQPAENTSPIRKTIAKRMMDSLQGSAQLTETAWADVTTLSENRKQWCPEANWTDWIFRAAVLTLQEYPILNASWRETGIEMHDRIHLGIAVDTQQGLFVPVIREAETLSLLELHQAAKEVVEKTKKGETDQYDLTGSTFTVTSLAGYGVQFFTPILNPPEAAILGIGQIETYVVLEDGTPVERQRLPLSLTFDHRIVDGAPAARFLQSLIQHLEHPENNDERIQ